MKEEYLRRLQIHRDRLVKEIDTLGIWTRLYQDEVITRHHVDMCKSMSTPSEQLESLLDTLEKRDDVCFDKFYRVVQCNNPELVKRCLERNATEEENADGVIDASVDSSSVSTRAFQHQAQNLERQNEKLRHKLERVMKMRMWMEKDTTNSQILEEHEGKKLKEVEAKMAGNLKKYKIRNYELSSRRAHRQKREEETEKLREERKDLEQQLGVTIDDIRRLELELETISKRNVDLKEEYLGVKKTNADNIGGASAMSLNREESQRSMGSSFLSLLSPQDLERLDRNQSFVTEVCGDMTQRDLLPMLASLNCISRGQRRSLDQSDDGQQLLNTIRSFSSANYDSFLVCLRKLDQIHIADILDYGGVAIKLKVGVRRLDEDARRRDPVRLLNDVSRRDMISNVFGCQAIKFLKARLCRPNEDMSIEMWVWCQTEDSLRVLCSALAAPGPLLKQLVGVFDALGIVQRGLAALFLPAGRPLSVTAAQNQFNGMFCPYLPYGHIVRKVKRQTPENGRRSAITGVAFLNDRAYVVSSGSSSIQVFQCSPRSFEALPDIHVRGLQSPVDMCASEDWLYVLERENERIWKVSASKSSTPNECFENVMAHALSFMPDGHLMLTVRGVHSSLVICQTSDGKAIRDITLPNGMDALWHGLGTDQGDFVVSHRRGDAHQVSKIQGETGTLRNSYTGSSTRLCSPLMDTPCHMTIDDEGQIYVADQKNSRVLLFDAELQLPRVLLMIEGGCPNRLAFDQETGQLLIGLDSGVVEVYMINEFKYHGIPEESEVNSHTWPEDHVP